MRKELIIGSIVLFLAVGPVSLLLGQDLDEYKDLNPHVYRITSIDCGPDSSRYLLSGAKISVNGTPGIVTALHGVVGCDSISARNSDHGTVNDLVITLIDVSHDVAFLTSSQLKDSDEYLFPASTDDGDLRVIGYPMGILYQMSHPQEFHENKLVQLAKLIPPGEIADALADRSSPSLVSIIYSLRGVLIGGYSGAPILNSNNEVVAIALGGLADGLPEINWATPTESLKWESLAMNRDVLDLLGQKRASQLYNLELPVPPKCSWTISDSLDIIVYNNGKIQEFQLSNDNFYVKLSEMGKRVNQTVHLNVWGLGFENEREMLLMGKDDEITSFTPGGRTLHKLELVKVKVNDENHSYSSIHFKVERGYCSN